MKKVQLYTNPSLIILIILKTVHKTALYNKITLKNFALNYIIRYVYFMFGTFKTDC